MSKYVFLLFLATGAFLTYDSLSENDTTKTVVCEMYTTICDKCGDNKKEGYYSYIDKTGYEECKNCGHYEEINNNN